MGTPDGARDVKAGHVDVSVLGREGQALVGLSEEYDAGDSLGEAAEAVAVRVGPVGGEQLSGREIEQKDGAIVEAGSKVVVREGETAAGECVGGGRQQLGVGTAAEPEVGGSAVEANELVAPGRERGTPTRPNAAAEILPQELRTGNVSPRRAHLQVPINATTTQTWKLSNVLKI